MTNAKVGTLQGDKIDVNTLNADRITTNSLDVRNKASSGTTGHVLSANGFKSGAGYNYGTGANTSIWFQTFGLAYPYHFDSSGTFNTTATPSLLKAGAQLFFRPEFTGHYLLSFNFESFGQLGAHRTFASVTSHTSSSSAYDF